MKFCSIDLKASLEEKNKFYQENDEVLQKFIDKKIFSFGDEQKYDYWSLNVEERLKKLDSDRKNFIVFLAEIYLVGLLKEYVLHTNILQKLLQNISYDSIEYLVLILEIIGSDIEVKRPKLAEDYFDILSTIFIEKRADSRSLCLILNLLELKSRHWKQSREIVDLPASLN